jgi:hypothetical protein
MAEQSHREEMSAAIRAQRERHAAPRTLAAADAPPPEAAEPAPEEQPAPKSEPEQHQRESFFSRFRGR